jgi:hypothetical protein
MVFEGLFLGSFFFCGLLLVGLIGFLFVGWFGCCSILSVYLWTSYAF